MRNTLPSPAESPSALASALKRYQRGKLIRWIVRQSLSLVLILWLFPKYPWLWWSLIAIVPLALLSLLQILRIDQLIATGSAIDTKISELDKVAQSLGADQRLLPFIDELLRDLWALGYPPEPMLRLLTRNQIAERPGVRVLDLGCGKGAALIALAKEFDWQGEGVDLVEEFIDEARCRATEHGVADRVQFTVADLADAVRAGPPVDLILFGHDTETLGDLQETLTLLQTRLAPAGQIMLDLAWKHAANTGDDDALTKDESKAAIAAAGLTIIDEEIIDADWLRALNRANTESIRRRAEELGRRHPEHQSWFEEYVSAQGDESIRLEEELVCAILLLAPKG